jgi:hypothetical protein
VAHRRRANRYSRGLRLRLIRRRAARNQAESMQPGRRQRIALQQHFPRRRRPQHFHQLLGAEPVRRGDRPARATCRSTSARRPPPDRSTERVRCRRRSCHRAPRRQPALGRVGWRAACPRCRWARRSRRLHRPHYPSAVDHPPTGQARAAMLIAYCWMGAPLGVILSDSRVSTLTARNLAARHNVAMCRHREAEGRIPAGRRPARRGRQATHPDHAIGSRT